MMTPNSSPPRWPTTASGNVCSMVATRCCRAQSPAAWPEPSVHLLEAIHIDLDEGQRLFFDIAQPIFEFIEKAGAIEGASEGVTLCRCDAAGKDLCDLPEIVAHAVIGDGEKHDHSRSANNQANMDDCCQSGLAERPQHGEYVRCGDGGNDDACTQEKQPDRAQMMFCMQCVAVHVL